MSTEMQWSSAVLANGINIYMDGYRNFFGEHLGMQPRARTVFPTLFIYRKKKVNAISHPLSFSGAPFQMTADSLVVAG